jgi:hypothetical protein
VIPIELATHEVIRLENELDAGLRQSLSQSIWNAGLTSRDRWQWQLGTVEYFVVIRQLAKLATAT